MPGDGKQDAQKGLLFLPLSLSLPPFFPASSTALTFSSFLFFFFLMKQYIKREEEKKVICGVCVEGNILPIKS